MSLGYCFLILLIIAYFLDIKQVLRRVILKLRCREPMQESAARHCCGCVRGQQLEDSSARDAGRGNVG